MPKTAPLWKFGEVNPSTPEFKAAREGDIVAFMPLEAVWPGSRAHYEGRIPWSSKLSYTQFRRGDILIPKITPTFEAGRTTIANIPTSIGLASTEVHVVRASETTDSRFLQYCFRSRPFLAEGESALQGVGNLRRITPRFVQELRVLDFDLATQQRIADYLDRETGEIDAMIAKMDELANNLRARLRAETHSVLAPAFASATMPIWSALLPIKDQNHPAEQVLSVYRDYGVIPKASRDDNNNRTPQDLTSYQLVEPGDVVINKMKAWQGSLGVSAHRGIVSPDYQVARPAREINSQFLHAVLRSPFMVPQYRARSIGVRPSQWRLYWSEFADLRIPLPPLDEQKRIADHLDEATSRIDAMLTKVAELRTLLTERRSALITDVVTGRKEAA